MTRNRTWSEAQSDRAWDEIGDRLIDAIRQIRRNVRINRLHTETLYTVEDVILTPVQVYALEVITARATWRMNELSAELDVDPSTATRTVDPLVSLGLVTRNPDESNRRYVVVSITRKGKEMTTVLAERRQALMRQLLSPMAPENRVILTELLEQYVQLALHFDEDGDRDS